MGFKLGKERGNYAVSGEIKTKMRFGKQSGGDGSVPGTPVIRVPLEEGDRFEILGEANMDGSIYVSDKLDPNSQEAQHVIMHEMIHATDMKVGKLAYSDDAVKWDGEIYPRKDGNIYFNKEWVPEGSKDFPWENDANNGNN